MHNVYIKDLINKFGGKLVCGDKNIVIENISKDTRTINKGDIYIGIKGDVFDGNLFFEDAFNKGAKCAILDNVKINKETIHKYAGKTIVIVPNSIKCLQDLARYKRSLYDIPVVAITGSVGKTSTKDMIASVLKEKYKVLKSEGNNNNHIGLPLTILKLKDEEALVVEMGMNNPGEISLLTNIAKPNVAVITNIGTAHIGRLGSRENILKAKLEILEGLDKNGYLIINNDNDLLHNELNTLRKGNKVITIGIENKSDYMAFNIKQEELKSTFTIDGNDVQLPIGGTPFIYNSLMGYAIGKIFEISNNKIIKGLEGFELSANRLSIKTNNKGITIIDDTYNANLDSVKSGLETLHNMSGKRKIAILGDMLELGSFSKDIHKEVGDCVVKNKIDYLVLVGNESKETMKEAINKGMNKDNIYWFKTSEETFPLLDKLLEKDDSLLIKGSHAMNLIAIVNYLLK
jgi:UDP-N-acetylmuramoyl-tripeptide--D-alanyl-D-alanine ligase